MKSEPTDANSSENGRASISINRLSIPVVSGIVAVVAIVSWTLVGMSQFAAMRLEYTTGHEQLAKQQSEGFADLAKQIREVSFKLELQDTHKGEYYTIADHRRFLLELLRNNPTIKLPENQ
jgi:hypothetical protein